MEKAAEKAKYGKKRERW